MNKIIKDIKNFINGNKELTAKSAFAIMKKELDEAENAYGKDIFPKEKLLTTEEVHYKTLKLKPDAPFEKIQEHYAKLKKKYDPVLYKNDNEKYKKALELNARVEIAFIYFKNKFKIDD